MTKVVPVALILRKTNLTLFGWKDDGQECFAISPIELRVMQKSFQDALDLFIETFNALHGQESIVPMSLSEKDILTALNNPNSPLRNLQEMSLEGIEPVKTSVKIKLLLEAELDSDYTPQDLYEKTNQRIFHPFLFSWALEESIFPK